eukprot:PLAT15942.1.p2 GENE.PLAT15942.1~~PLAT15942.1.p2  ORF type:complete len:368 (+),score=83.19 PLAT15942.1:87-1106(+)
MAAAPSAALVEELKSDSVEKEAKEDIFDRGGEEDALLDAADAGFSSGEEEEADSLSHMARLTAVLADRQAARGSIPKLSEEDAFSWASIMRDIYKMPQKRVGSMHYKIRHLNRFIQLYTLRGECYWLTQAICQHATPDWKLHVSVVPDDLGMAWDIIAHLFMRLGCRFGMKCHCERSTWPDFMRGREITVYIFRYHEDYARDPLIDRNGDVIVMAKEHERPASFWLSFIATIEDRLQAAGVRPQGIAEGDRPVGRYVSIRNEAFVAASADWDLPDGWTGLDRARPIEGQPVYPPNVAGWNGAAHAYPLRLPRRKSYTVPVLASLLVVTLLVVAALLFAR